jgi:putative transposase
MKRAKRKASHTVFDMRVHLVWITKYRYKVLNGGLEYRVRELVKQFCCENDIYILKGVVSKDHVHYTTPICQTTFSKFLFP